jgi:hypothetical protein
LGARGEVKIIPLALSKTDCCAFECQVHYDRYNKRFGKDGIHETLTWDAEVEAVEDFKKTFIYPEMIDGEVKVTLSCFSLRPGANVMKTVIPTTSVCSDIHIHTYIHIGRDTKQRG